MSAPSEIVATYIIDTLGLMSRPGESGAWPLYVSYMPDGIRECGAIFDTSGVEEIRDMNGEQITHHGLQLRLRGEDYVETWVKIKSIMNEFRLTQNVSVEISSGLVYTLNALTQTTAIVPMHETNEILGLFDFASNYLATLISV